MSATDEWYLGDVDSDFAADLIVRSGDTVRVALYDGSDFGELSPWGSLPAGRRVMVGDVNGDQNADLVALDETNGQLTQSTSTGSAFRAPSGFGSVPVGYRSELIDGDGDGQRDVAGQQPLTGELRVALTRMAVAPGPSAGDWQRRATLSMTARTRPPPPIRILIRL